MAENLETRQDIIDDINGYMHGPTTGFFSKYFGRLAKSDAASLNRDPDPLPAALPTNLWHWFATLFTDDCHGYRLTWRTKPLVNSGRSVDSGGPVFLTSNDPDRHEGNEWVDVRVVGEYRSNYGQYEGGFLDLCAHARQVFASQPTRLFLHGFYILESSMELWVFDRSGMYSCDVFDVQRDTSQFLTVMDRYKMMSDEELGMSSIIENAETGKRIIASPIGQLYLENLPLRSSEDVVGEGTTVYRAKREHSNGWDYVVKFKWQLASDRPEEQLWNIANNKKVWGMVSLDYHNTITSTANLRTGLKFVSTRQFPSEKHQANTSHPQGQSDTRTAGINGYTEETDRHFEDRILNCIITSPVGRPLHAFGPPLELLQVFRDAIKGHRSLYQDARILHQDVSLDNIIITDAQDHGEPRGILIDLDSAMELDNRQALDEQIIGTRRFMAIGVLKSRRHTYRHDLESFLYVFLFVVIANRSENLPATSMLRRWSSQDSSWEDLAALKTHDMDAPNFNCLLAEFPAGFEALKPVATKLHQLLFPPEEGTMWTGTVGSLKGTNELYDGILGAFDEAIGHGLDGK